MKEPKKIPIVPLLFNAQCFGVTASHSWIIVSFIINYGFVGPWVLQRNCKGSIDYFVGRSDIRGYIHVLLLLSF